METPVDTPIKDEHESPRWKKSTVVFVLGNSNPTLCIINQASRLNFCGGPGSGKGTQCTNVVKHFTFTHFSAGDLLRAEIKSGSQFGAMIQSMIAEGGIVPFEITVKLLCKAMEESGNDKFLIDGFPRNEENRIVYETVAKMEPAFVLFFDCPEDELERRIMNRNQGREDDNIETIKKRFKVFVESTTPIVSYYESKGKLRKINAAKPSEEVFEAVKDLFSSYET